VMAMIIVTIMIMTKTRIIIMTINLLLLPCASHQPISRLCMYCDHVTIKAMTDWKPLAERMRTSAW
jgi:hypothetical protein